MSAVEPDYYYDYICTGCEKEEIKSKKKAIVLEKLCDECDRISTFKRVSIFGNILGPKPDIKKRPAPMMGHDDKDKDGPPRKKLPLKIKPKVPDDKKSAILIVSLEKCAFCGEDKCESGIDIYNRISTKACPPCLRSMRSYIDRCEFDNKHRKYEPILSYNCSHKNHTGSSEISSEFYMNSKCSYCQGATEVCTACTALEHAVCKPVLCVPCRGRSDLQTVPYCVVCCVYMYEQRWKRPEYICESKNQSYGCTDMFFMHDSCAETKRKLKQTFTCGHCLP